MTREDIICMAREAWLSDKEAQLITEFDEAYISCTYLQDLQKFAALVASAEREACAVAAEKESLRGLPEEQPEGEELLHACAQIAGGVLIADAIRARGQA